MTPPATVRMFGLLYSIRQERGLPSVVELDLPEEGVSARQIAIDLELPVDDIEGVFCNHVVHSLDHRIRPGDRVAFVPPGTPGPHRFLLGLYRVGKEDAGNAAG
ncbi:MAG: MoaD/ThiS family protein [Coriobacteriia bacterium]|nr:MoaD/ThiS family protein [Coriobacteriia bacterium]